jgi:hypothetical protein
LASAVNVIGPHNVCSAAGNPSRQHDSRELSAERAQVALNHPRITQALCEIGYHGTVGLEAWAFR